MNQTGNRVGYLWSEKKNQKHGDELYNTGRSCGIEFVRLQIDKPLEEQGPFSAIVHPVIKTEKDPDLPIFKEIEKYAKKHPETLIIESVALNGLRLANRFNQYTILDEVFRAAGGAFVPAFVELTSNNMAENVSKMEAAGVGFPCVCKPTFAHGSSLAHQMCIVFNTEGLMDISPPCVVQQFINHNAVLYKIFVLGNEYYIMERPSLKNFSAGNQKTIFFNSHLVSKANCASDLTSLDEDELKTPTIPLEKEKVDHVIQSLCQTLRMSLVGIDLIIDNVTGQYAIFDVNAFPGYDGVSDFLQLYCDFVLERIILHQRGSNEILFKPTMTNRIPYPFKNTNHNEEEEAVDSALPSPTKKYVDLIPYESCCSISTSSRDGALPNESSPRLMPPSAPEELSPAIELLNGKEKDRNALTFFMTSQFQDSTQDDSGIETSDSCDEKKKKATVLKISKRQHSRHHRLQTTSEGSG